MEAVASADEHSQQPVDRLISRLARVVNSGAGTGQPVERVELEERKMRSEIEAFLAHASQSGGVVLGRGAAVVLRTCPVRYTSTSADPETRASRR